MKTTSVAVLLLLLMAFFGCQQKAEQAQEDTQAVAGDSVKMGSEMMEGMRSQMAEEMGAGMMGQQEKSDTTKSSSASSDTTKHPTDLGVGPVKSVKLGPLDPQLAKQGHQLFEEHCSMCHALQTRKVGPALGDVVGQRTPEFIMNMVLNASQMERHDPTGKRLLAQYQVPMPTIGLTEKQARAILEYFRSVAPKKKSK